MTLLSETLGQSPIAISSREIAGLVGSRHNELKNFIDRLVLWGVMIQPPTGFEQEILITPTGERRTLTMSVYLLEKRDSFMVVAQHSPEFSARLADVWQELEGMAQEKLETVPDLSNPHVLLRVLAEHAASQAEASRSAAEFVRQFVNADGLYDLPHAARVLGQPFDMFVGWLRQRHLFYQDGELVPRAIYLNQGIFQVKATLIDGKAGCRTFVTPKGIRSFAKKLGVEVEE